MTTTKKPVHEKMIKCAVCLKEVPISEAKSHEASDYVRHFCGLDCFGKWREQDKTLTNGDAVS